MTKTIKEKRCIKSGKEQRAGDSILTVLPTGLSQHTHACDELYGVNVFAGAFEQHQPSGSFLMNDCTTRNIWPFFGLYGDKVKHYSRGLSVYIESSTFPVQKTRSTKPKCSLVWVSAEDLPVHYAWNDRHAHEAVHLSWRR